MPLRLTPEKSSRSRPQDVCSPPQGVSDAMGYFQGIMSGLFTELRCNKVRVDGILWWGKDEDDLLFTLDAIFGPLGGRWSVCCCAQVHILWHRSLPSKTYFERVYRPFLDSEQGHKPRQLQCLPSSLGLGGFKIDFVHCDAL